MKPILVVLCLASLLGGLGLAKSEKGHREVARLQEIAAMRRIAR
jgi:hypothetical protein